MSIAKSALRAYDIPFGSIFNIPIKISVLLPLFVVFQSLTHLHFGGKAALWAFIVFGPILFIIVLIHELGRSLAARCVGGKAHFIILWPLGGISCVSHDAGPGGDLYVTLAATLSHIPQGVCWYLLCLILGSSGTPQHPFYSEAHFGLSLVATAFWLNSSIMLFNLCCPAYPLDGGRLLVDVLLLANVPTKITAWITIVIAIVVAASMAVATAMYHVFHFGGPLIAVFILISTLRLFYHMKNDRLEQHPLFKSASESSDEVHPAEMIPKTVQDPASNTPLPEV